VLVDQTVAELVPILGKRAACAALGRSRATYYRHHRQSPLPARQPRAPRPQPRALSQAERDEVLAVLHQERFVDQAPASIYATLLDEGRYVCSVPTLYRVLRAADEVHERRRQARHPATVKPELVATHPNSVWSWDIERHEAPTTVRR
jgi:putative transposase